MKIILIILLTLTLNAQELKIKAKTFSSDQTTGISIFEGNVEITQSNDELNASKVSIYTNEKQEPVKYIAEGNVSFVISTDGGVSYRGRAQKTIYLPNEEEYRFYGDVYLKQVGDKKEIIGDEVIFKTKDGKAQAKSKTDKPVIMIFGITQKEEK